MDLIFLCTSSFRFRRRQIFTPLPPLSNGGGEVGAWDVWSVLVGVMQGNGYLKGWGGNHKQKQDPNDGAKSLLKKFVLIGLITHGHRAWPR